MEATHVTIVRQKQVTPESNTSFYQADPGSSWHNSDSSSTDLTNPRWSSRGPPSSTSVVSSRAFLSPALPEAKAAGRRDLERMQQQQQQRQQRLQEGQGRRSNDSAAASNGAAGVAAARPPRSMPSSPISTASTSSSRFAWLPSRQKQQQQRQQRSLSSSLSGAPTTSGAAAVSSSSRPAAGDGTMVSGGGGGGGGYGGAGGFLGNEAEMRKASMGSMTDGGQAAAMRSVFSESGTGPRRRISFGRRSSRLK